MAFSVELGFVFQMKLHFDLKVSGAQITASGGKWCFSRFLQQNHLHFTSFTSGFSGYYQWLPDMIFVNSPSLGWNILSQNILNSTFKSNISGHFCHNKGIRIFCWKVSGLVLVCFLSGEASESDQLKCIVRLPPTESARKAIKCRGNLKPKHLPVSLDSANIQ